MWQLMGHTPIARAGSDQNRFNSILVAMRMTWKPFVFQKRKYLKGRSADGSLTVITLPEDVACRDSCDINQLSSYYVCHPHTTHQGFKKGPNLLKQGLWIINDEWNKTSNTIQNTSEWLEEVII